ncbi:MAG: bifunctional 5,10-methylenetetrahydrofolate dehydrogenase/5,10-methenyltetrahydrofolate cyclohydrolase [Candidatus Roizmanbacteria bacterium]
MKISGRVIAKELYEELYSEVAVLAKKNIIPHLVIIKSVDIEAVNNYIGQKLKKGEKSGIKVTVIDISHDIFDVANVKNKISKLNADQSVHGIIFQKPSSPIIDDSFDQLIDPIKDVDGFRSDSRYFGPVYLGVRKVFETIYTDTKGDIIEYLKTLNIVIIGKGKTGGKPVINGLKKDGIVEENIHVIDSQTSEEITQLWIQNADVIISAVGKANPVPVSYLRSSSILIDIGIHFNEQNEIQSDFNKDEINDIVAYYTTSPGGIGALTVVYLLKNVVASASTQ